MGKPLLCDSVLALTLSWLLMSCGHTLLQKNQFDLQSVYSSELLPDLIITDVGVEWVPTWFMDDPNPSFLLYFCVKIANIGKSAFRGSLALAWADNLEGIKWQAFAHFERFQIPQDSLEINDSAVVRIYAGSVKLRAETDFRFLLATQKAMPGISKTYFKDVEDVQEMNYHNNLFDYKKGSLLECKKD